MQSGSCILEIPELVSIWCDEGLDQSSRVEKGMQFAQNVIRRLRARLLRLSSPLLNRQGARERCLQNPNK